VIVPAGGVAPTDVEIEVKNYLQKHALPNVQVTVSNFKALLFDLDLTIRIKVEEFIAAEVEAAVSAAISEHFSLRNRKLGQHLYLSEVYKIVEAIQGVENSIAILNGMNNLKVIEATDTSTTIYLDTNAGSSLDVATEEYLP